MYCSKCGSGDHKVIDTVSKPNGIERVRKCLKCGHPWLTVEEEREGEVEDV